jgi:hypothetical protein
MFPWTVKGCVACMLYITTLPNETISSSLAYSRKKCFPGQES